MNTTEIKYYDTIRPSSPFKPKYYQTNILQKIIIKQRVTKTVGQTKTDRRTIPTKIRPHGKCIRLCHHEISYHLVQCLIETRKRN